MAVSITVNADPEGEIGEIISDLYCVMAIQPYTAKALIPVLCAIEYTDWGCDGNDAYMIHRELSEAISKAVAGVFDRHASGCLGSESRCTAGDG